MIRAMTFYRRKMITSYLLLVVLGVMGLGDMPRLPFDFEREFGARHPFPDLFAQACFSPFFSRGIHSGREVTPRGNPPINRTPVKFLGPQLFRIQGGLRLFGYYLRWLPCIFLL